MSQIISIIDISLDHILPVLFSVCLTKCQTDAKWLEREWALLSWQFKSRDCLQRHTKHSKSMRACILFLYCSPEAKSTSPFTLFLQLHNFARHRHHLRIKYSVTRANGKKEFHTHTTALKIFHLDLGVQYDNSKSKEDVTVMKEGNQGAQYERKV